MKKDLRKKKLSMNFKENISKEISKDNKWDLIINQVMINIIIKH